MRAIKGRFPPVFQPATRVAGAPTALTPATAATATGAAARRRGSASATPATRAAAAKRVSAALLAFKPSQMMQI